MHAHAALKQQAEALRRQLDLTIETADLDDHIQAAQSNAFHGLMADCRDIARDLERSIAFGDMSPESYKRIISQAASALQTAQSERFNHYMDTRDKPSTKDEPRG